jgi:RNA polymerase sigma factor (sigma-70 family)
MPGASSRDVLRHLNTLFHCGTTGQLSDAELLETFAAGAGRCETAEAAFAALVERHGKMVLGVCQRVLGNHEAAEDAFQATFLVLARKAAAIARREQLANWLYGVALRAALEARGRAAREKSREKRYRAMLPALMPDPRASNEMCAVLDEELARLPERYRSAIVLCELEGLPRRQAAAQLGISEGTLSSRLARAKIQLKDRLTRRGAALSSVALGAFLAQDALAVVVRPMLEESTIQLATLVSSGSCLAGIVSTPVAILTEGVLKAMLFAKLKSVCFGIATVALLTTGMGVVAQQADRSPSPDDRLKAVERKLDRLLEVLGRSNRPLAATPVTVPAGVAPVASAAAPAPASPDAADAAPAATPAASSVPAPAPVALPDLPPAPPTPSADMIPNPPPPVVRGPQTAPGVLSTLPPQPATVPTPPAMPAGGGSGPRANSGQLQSLTGRVQALEHRLAEFERRLAGIERRLQQTPGGAPASGTRGRFRSLDSAPAPLATSSPTAAGVDTPPNLPLSASGDALPTPPVSATPSAIPPPLSQDETRPPSPPSDEPPSETPR